jgi:hypothetical protein
MNHPHIWGMTHETWSYVIWGAWIALFLMLEFSARDLLGWSPGFTLSQTVKTLIRDHPWVALILICGMPPLALHLLFPDNRWGL